MKTKRPLWIPVVTALILKGTKVMVGLRPKGKNLAGQWEFPGGKIETGESPEDALARELREELGIEAEIGNIVYAGTQSYGETGILLLFYVVKFWKGEPKNIHHSEIKWVELQELDNLDIPGANRKVLPHLLSHLN